MRIGLSLCRVVVGLLAFCVLASLALAQDDQDANRPPCVTPQCRRIEAFVKRHYCGNSPAGDGPDNGCEMKRPKRPQTGVEVLAAYHCTWNDEAGIGKCNQERQPPGDVRKILTQEMQRIGLLAKANGQTLYTVWKSGRSGLVIASADYSRVAGSKLDLCEVIVAINEKGNVTLIRKVPFKTTDADVPDVTTWSLVDLADVEGDGHEEIVLEGDAYEDHWFEVVRVQGGAVKTIFSGLGYYL